MFRGIFSAAGSEGLSKRHSVGVVVDGTARVDSILLGQLRVRLDESGHELAQKDSAAVAKDGAVLLGAMRLDYELAFGDHTALEHNGARLIAGHFDITQADVVVGHTAVAVDDGLLTLPSVHHLNQTRQLLIELCVQLQLEELFVGQRNGLGHGLDHLPVRSDYGLVLNLNARGSHVQHDREAFHLVC